MLVGLTGRRLGHDGRLPLFRQSSYGRHWRTIGAVVVSVVVSVAVAATADLIRLPSAKFEEKPYRN